MSDKPSDKSVILGTFKGECADAAITNKNGIDITYDVWNNVFNSDIYKESLELGHYIGFLGHPDDPDDQDFEHACIVMTEGHIDPDSKVYGEFNLIDTPVGRIVRTFQKAGVTFGISVRGAGDIVGHSVDPDTFDFRGFDLVTFPAYPNAIPEFTEIAASTDSKQRRRYQTICAAVEAELPYIDDQSTLESLQGMFPEQSDTYAKIEDKLGGISEPDGVSEQSPREELLEMQRDGMYMLWRETAEDLDTAEEMLKEQAEQHEAAKLEASRKLKSIRRICADQAAVADSIERHAEVLASKIGKLERKLESEHRKYVAAAKKLDKAAASLASLKTRYATAITASSRSNEMSSDLAAENDSLRAEIAKLEAANLTISKKIDASNDAAAEKDDIIASLREDLRETVSESERIGDKVANLETENAKLAETIGASERMIAEYQDAYAGLYSNAVGAIFNSDVSVSASTSVQELKRLIHTSARVPFEVDELRPEDMGDADENDIALV